MSSPNHSDSNCLRVWESMPWVLQNSAPREQVEWVRDHIAHCAPCRAEFAQQRRLHRALLLPVDVQIDAKASLKHLLARLDTYDSDAAYSPALSAGWLNRALIAAVLVQAIGIGILGARLWNTGSEAQYHTLSRESTPVISGSIRLVPNPDMTLAEWNALLRTQHLRVIDGPNDVGAYAVVLTDAAFASPHTVEQLRTTRGIRLAEPIATPP